MPDGSSENLFKNIRAIGQELSGSWPGNTIIGEWNHRITVSAWPLSVQPHDSSDVFDYFLVELNGQSSLRKKADRSIAGYQLNISFNQPLSPPYKTEPGPFGLPMPITQGPPAGIELIASSPDTSVASVSYSDSVSKTIGGSIGFFGDVITGSVSASTTISNSTTRSVSDLRIVNLSGVDDNLSCCWQYLVTQDSLEAEGETPLLAQFLIRRPHAADPFKFSVFVYAFFNNDSDNDLGDADWSGLGQWVSGFVGDNLATIVKGNARIGISHDIQLSAPPPPPPAPKTA